MADGCWEFMRLAEEKTEVLGRAGTAWRLLAPFDVHPGNATLGRHAVYMFQGRWAVRFEAGRMICVLDPDRAAARGQASRPVPGPGRGARPGRRRRAVPPDF